MEEVVVKNYTWNAVISVHTKSGVGEMFFETHGESPHLESAKKAIDAMLATALAVVAVKR